MITVTSKDALRSEQLEPGWRVGKCTKHNEQTSNKDGSTYHEFEIEVDHKGQRAPLKNYIVSEKAVSMGKGFFIACGFPEEKWEALVEGKEKSVTIDPKSCVDREFRVMVSNKEYEGRIQNVPTDFLPL